MKRMGMRWNGNERGWELKMGMKKDGNERGWE